MVPSNDYLWMSAGPPLDVKQKAGEDVELSAVRQGPLKLGDVAVTEAGRLPLLGIVHAVVMGQDLVVGADAAAAALVKAIDLAEEKGWTRVLVHSLHATGRGTPRTTVQRCLGAMVERLLQGSGVRQIVLLAADEADRKALHEDMLLSIQKHE